MFNIQHLHINEHMQKQEIFLLLTFINENKYGQVQMQIQQLYFKHFRMTFNS